MKNETIRCYDCMDFKDGENSMDIFELSQDLDLTKSMSPMLQENKVNKMMVFNQHPLDI